MGAGFGTAAWAFPAFKTGHVAAGEDLVELRGLLGLEHRTDFRRRGGHDLIHLRLHLLADRPHLRARFVHDLAYLFPLREIEFQLVIETADDEFVELLGAALHQVVDMAVHQQAVDRGSGHDPHEKDEANPDDRFGFAHNVLPVIPST